MQAGGDGLAAAGRGWRDLMCGVAGVGDTDTMAEQEGQPNLQFEKGKGPIFIPGASMSQFLECP